MSLNFVRKWPIDYTIAEIPGAENVFKQKNCSFYKIKPLAEPTQCSGHKGQERDKWQSESLYCSLLNKHTSSGQWRRRWSVDPAPHQPSNNKAYRWSIIKVKEGVWSTDLAPQE